METPQNPQERPPPPDVYYDMFKLVEKANEEKQSANSVSHEKGEVKSGVKAAIGRLEGTNN